MKNRNEVIAEFMEFTYEKNLGWCDNNRLMPQIVYDTNRGNCFDDLLFDQSWDWIIPVVQTIEAEFQGYILNDLSLYSNLSEVYWAVLEFINQHNKK